MKKISLAFLYNIRHVYPNPDDPKSQLEADFDDPTFIKRMILHFKNCGFKVIPIEADENAYLKLYRHKDKIDLAFNYSEGIYGQDREAQIPAMLEMLQIPYTGSKPLTQALALNKAKTKEVLIANNILTAPFQVFQSSSESLQKNLSFPLIVKPAAQGSSAGITNDSVVKNKKELTRQINIVIKTFNQPALVESFLVGQEFSVAMLGNPPEILPIISPNHNLLPKKYHKIDSLEVKWHFEEEEQGKDYLKCPAEIDKSLEKKIKDICFKTWNALNILDWCRIDLRLDMDESVHVLEINSPAGLIPPAFSQSSYFPLAARAAGIDYETLLKKITASALKRYS